MQKKIIFYLLGILLFLIALLVVLSYIGTKSFPKGGNEATSTNFVGPPPGAVPYVKGPTSPPPGTLQ
jgi:hypothetical protein